MTEIIEDKTENNPVTINKYFSIRTWIAGFGQFFGRLDGPSYEGLGVSFKEGTGNVIGMPPNIESDKFYHGVIFARCYTKGVIL